MNENIFTDSAGVPWEGRNFESNRFAFDDGSTPESVQKALIDFSSSGNLAGVLESLAGNRLLIPLLATLGESEVGSHGQVVDKSAELAIVAVSTPDQKTAIPAFTSVADMQKWRVDARPVPVESERVAISAIDEGHERIIINPATHSIAVRRPALEALAQQLKWIHPVHNPEVEKIIEQACGSNSAIVGFELFNPDPWSKLAGPELGIALKILPGLTATELKRLLREFSQSIQTQRFLELTDSIELKLVAS